MNTKITSEFLETSNQLNNEFFPHLLSTCSIFPPEDEYPQQNFPFKIFSVREYIPVGSLILCWIGVMGTTSTATSALLSSEGNNSEAFHGDSFWRRCRIYLCVAIPWMALLMKTSICLQKDISLRPINMALQWKNHFSSLIFKYEKMCSTYPLVVLCSPPERFVNLGLMPRREN